MRKSFTLVLSFLLLNGACLLGQDNNDCSKFVILDTVTSGSNYATYERVKDVTCSDEVKNSGDAKSAAIKAGIPIPVLDDVFSINFAGSGSSSSFENWKKSFCTSHYSEVQKQLSSYNISKVFSDNAAKTVDECFKSKQPVYGYFKINGSEGLVFQMRATGKEALKRARIEPPDAVKNCDPQNPFELPGLDKFFTDLDISGQQKGFSCSWVSGKSLRLTVKLKNQGDYIFDLPTFVSRPVEVTPTAASLAEYMQSGHRVALRFDGVDIPSASWEQNGQIYTVWYDQGGKLWWGIGKVRNSVTRTGADAVTTCPQSAPLAGSHPVTTCYRPSDNIVVIWQGAYQFDNGGIVYGGNDEKGQPVVIGHMTKLD